MSTKPYTRQLTFKSNGLGDFLTLVFIFDDGLETDAAGNYTKQCPVIVQASEFQSEGVSIASFKYHNQLGWIKPGPLVGNVIVDTASSQILQLGQITTLQLDNVTGKFSFTDPETGTAGKVEVKNGVKPDPGVSPTGKESIALGYSSINPDQPLTAVYFWGPDKFPPQDVIPSRLNTKLRVYLSDQYQDNQVITSKIPATLLLDKELSELANNTVWILTFNSGTNQYEIRPELN